MDYTCSLISANDTLCPRSYHTYSVHTFVLYVLEDRYKSIHRPCSCRSLRTDRGSSRHTRRYLCILKKYLVENQNTEPKTQNNIFKDPNKHDRFTTINERSQRNCAFAQICSTASHLQYRPAKLACLYYMDNKENW